MVSLGRGTGDGENPGFGPEPAGIIVIERQVEELAGLEAGQGPLGHKINGINMIAVIGNFLNPATEFLWGRHWVIGFVEFVESFMGRCLLYDYQALHLGIIVRFFNSVHMRGCKITSAVNDPYNVNLVRFDLVEDPV